MKFYLEILEKAQEARCCLDGNPTAYRVVNGIGDGLDGVALDRYANHYQLQFFNSVHLEQEAELIAAVRQLLNPDFLVVKYRLEATGKALETPQMRVVCGTPATSATEVEEYGCRFHVDLLDTVNPGLFLDMRSIRDAVGQLSTGREMLNLFSYTCSFGVHARMNGALRSVNVDVSPKILEKGRANYILNGLEPQPGEFFKGDSAEYLDWAVRKGRTFHTIVLDPPSFARNRNGIFRVKENMGQLVRCCADILEHDGFLMTSTNYSAWSPQDLEELVVDTFRAAGHKAQVEWLRGQGSDFPGSGQMKESCLASVLIRKKTLSR